MTICKYCSLPIDFNDDIVSASGKKIPLDIESHLPHNCLERPRHRARCNSCDQEIFFIPSMKNPANNKLIPQDIWGNHRCKGKERIVRF